MIVRGLLRAGLVATVGLSMGCSGSPSATPAAPPLAHSNAIARTAQQAGVYVSTVSGLALYTGVQSDAQPECVAQTGTGIINKIGVDPRHVLWVPEGQGGNGYVTLFGPHCGQPIQTIVDNDGQPVAVTFDGAGDAYVENFAPGDGNIDVYAAGQLTSPATQLVEQNAYNSFGEAIDGAGNVYMSYDATLSETSGTVAEFVGGQNPPVELGMTVSGCASEVLIDAAGHLLLDQDGECGQGYKNLIAVYKQPYGPKTRIATIPLKGPSFSCALGNGGVNLYCADSRTGNVDVYAYDAAKPARTFVPIQLAGDPAFGLDRRGRPGPAVHSLGVSSRDIYGSVCIDVAVPELIGFDIGLLELFGIVVLLEVLLSI